MPVPLADSAPAIQAVLLDFDGTLADSYPGIAASVNHVRAGHGLPPLPVAEVRRHVGRGPAHLLERTVPAGSVAGNVARYKAHHPAVMKSGTQLFPGAAAALAELRRLGVRLAICSNKPRAFTVELMAHFELSAMFDCILGPEDVPRPKPAPDMLKKGLARLNVAPAAAVYVGDMVVDIETARGASVAVWVVPTGSDEPAALYAARPERVLESIRQLPTLVRPGSAAP